jgi:rhamnosyltransferase
MSGAHGGRPLVSVLLVTRDGAATLGEILAAVRGQRTDFPFEVVAIDSGSTDGTAKLLARGADRLLEIAPNDFNHGTTRNAGVAACRGELVTLLVQDALPAADNWLESLTAPLRRDPRLAGTCARQLPRPAASAVTRHYLAGWAAAAAEPRTMEVRDAQAWSALAPAERLALCTFDDVCACIRRSVWERFPFRPTAIAEDVEWAREVLLAGWRLAYVPEARVVHSHERSARHELRRTRAIHRRLGVLCGLRTIPAAGHLLRAFAATLPLHARLAWRQPAGLPRALALAVAWPLGQYLGGREAARDLSATTAPAAAAGRRPAATGGH